MRIVDALKLIRDFIKQENWYTLGSHVVYDVPFTISFFACKLLLFESRICAVEAVFINSMDLSHHVSYLRFRTQSRGESRELLGARGQC